MRFLIIDESGRLADRNDRYLVFAAVVADTLVGLDKVVTSVSKKMKNRLRPHEIKFSTTGDKTRVNVLERIKSKRIQIYVLTIDKEGRKIVDNVENYSLMISFLVREVLKKFPGATHCFIDRHFTYITQREKFNDLLQKQAGKKLFIEHLDSQQNTIISLPDFVAGAFRLGHSKNEGTFARIIERHVIKEFIYTWREFSQKK